jgi:hypothetical protein
MLDKAGRSIEFCTTFIDALEDVKTKVTIPPLPFFDLPEFAALIESRTVNSIRANVMYIRADRFMVNKRGKRRVRQLDSQDSPEEVKQKLETVLRGIY